MSANHGHIQFWPYTTEKFSAKCSREYSTFCPVAQGGWGARSSHGLFRSSEEQSGPHGVSFLGPAAQRAIEELQTNPKRHPKVTVNTVRYWYFASHQGKLGQRLPPEDATEHASIPKVGVAGVVGVVGVRKWPFQLDGRCKRRCGPRILPPDFSFMCKHFALFYDILDLGVNGTSEDYVNICQLDGWKVAGITPLEDWSIEQQINLDLHKKK